MAENTSDRVKTIETMKFQKQPSKFIKPSVPTPSSLKYYKIGFIDKLAPLRNVSIVLFYTKNRVNDPRFVVHLKKSLEKTLTRLYPLAGRFVEENDQIVDCNDEGVEFIQAKVNINLKDILGLEANIMSIDEFIPILNTKPQDILIIQLTTFECGGVALDVCATHAVVDASTLCTFLNGWAAMNREENEIKFMMPGFISPSLFPARGFRPIPLQLITDDAMLSKYTSKKVSFSASAILNMKDKAIIDGKSGTSQFSKLQLVSATIWKALIGVDRANKGYPRQSMLFQPINLRGKMASSIPKYSCGNLWAICATKPTILETTEALANLLNDSVTKARNYYSKVHHDSEQGQTMVLNSFLNMDNIPNSTNVIPISSWCKFPFYESDFGFGKPVWAVPGTVPVKNSAHLIGDKEGNGVEAFVFLDVKDVPYFEEALDVDIFGA